MNHLEASQIVFGLILQRKKSPQAVLWDSFAEPFNDAVKFCQENPDWSKEDLVKIIAPSFMQESEYAIKALNGMGDSTDWLAILKDFSEDNKLGETLERAAKSLKKGKPVDYLVLSGHLQSRIMKQSNGLTLGKDVDCTNYNPFMESGYEPFDNIIGGIPSDGPIIAYGLTGVGKSHWAANLISKFLHKHKDKTGAVYTLEMSAEHWKWRETAMYPELNDVMDRLYISGSVKNIEELIAEVSTRQSSIVVIDDIDGLAIENSAAEFERLYKKLKEICRFLKIPAVALAQPNRAAKLSNKFLQRYDIAWSGAAEDSSALLVALQRANELDLDEENSPFPLYEDDHEYLICWKSRDGWPADYPEKFTKGQRGPGAIILRPSDRGLWNGDIIGANNGSVGTLWRPYGVRKLVTKKGNNKNG